MGKKKRRRQADLWVASSQLARSPGHPFYEALNEVLSEHGFDDFVEELCGKFYAEKMGRPGRPGCKVPATTTTEVAPLRRGSLGTTTSGTLIQGQRAFLNHRLFRLDMVNHGDGPDAFLSFSAPKIFHGDNFHSLSGEQIVAVFGRVQLLLEEEGVYADVEQARLSRLDIFDNVETDLPPELYFRLLEHLRFKRMRSLSYATTQLWSNRQWALVVYDKIAEMESRGCHVAGLPPRVLRFELRLLKKKKIKQVLGFDTVPELLSGFDRVRDCFRGVLAGDLFSGEFPAHPVLPADGLADQLRYYQQNEGRYWLSKFLTHDGLHGLEGAGSFPALQQAVSEVQGRQGRHRLAQMLREKNLLRAVMAQSAVSETSLQALYRELEEKLLGPGAPLRRGASTHQAYTGGAGSAPAATNCMEEYDAQD